MVVLDQWQTELKNCVAKHQENNLDIDITIESVDDLMRDNVSIPFSLHWQIHELEEEGVGDSILVLWNDCGFKAHTIFSSESGKNILDQIKSIPLGDTSVLRIFTKEFLNQSDDE